MGDVIENLIHFLDVPVPPADLDKPQTVKTSCREIEHCQQLTVEGIYGVAILSKEDLTSDFVQSQKTNIDSLIKVAKHTTYHDFLIAWRGKIHDSKDRANFRNDVLLFFYGDPIFFNVTKATGTVRYRVKKANMNTLFKDKPHVIAEEIDTKEKFLVDLYIVLRNIIFFEIDF